MAQSKDYNELQHMWANWHDETGRPLRSKFIRYVELSNDAARLNGKTATQVICNKSHQHRPPSRRYRPHSLRLANTQHLFTYSLFGRESLTSGSRVKARYLLFSCIFLCLLVYCDTLKRFTMND